MPLPADRPANNGSETTHTPVGLHLPLKTLSLPVMAWRRRVGLAAACGGALFVLGTIAALLKPTLWEASQPVLVRADALRTDAGDVSGEQHRRNLLDTLVSLVQSPEVLKTVLQEVGPERTGRRRDFPSPQDLDDLKEALRITPAGGSDLGTSDVLLIKLRARDRRRAMRLVETLVRQANAQFRQLQVSRAEDVLRELSQAEAAAEATLRRDQDALRRIEQTLGADALALRGLSEKADTTSLNMSLDALESQLQDHRRRLLTYQQLWQVLQDILHHPERLTGVPSSLLETHPALRRLQEALTDAEVKLIQQQGQFTAEHPQVAAAREAVDVLRRRIADEVPAVLGTIESELQVLQAQSEFLQKQRDQEVARVQAILNCWPEYQSLSSRLKSETDTLQNLRQRLNAAQVSLAAARETQLLVPIQSVHTGSRPVGPGRLTIIAASCICGLALAGAVFLWLTPAVPQQVANHPTLPIGHAGPEDFQETKALPEAPALDPPEPSMPAAEETRFNHPFIACPAESPLHRALVDTLAPSAAWSEPIHER